MSARQHMMVRRFVRQGAATAGTVLLSVLATLLVMRGLVPPQVTAQSGQASEVRASAFVLVGADGTELARLAPGPQGHGSLTLFDTAGKPRVNLGGAGFVRVFDADGITPRMGMGLNPLTGGGGFVVRDSAGRARLDLSVTQADEFARLAVLDEQERTRVIVGMGPGGQGVQVRDGNGQLVATLP